MRFNGYQALHASDLAHVQRETNGTLRPTGLTQDQAARAPALYLSRQDEEDALDAIAARREEELIAIGDTMASRQRKARRYWGRHGVR